MHHPLTLLYGAWITPAIKSNTLGFIVGLVFVVGIALILYEIHLRIPLLRFLFSGKPMNKPAKTRLRPANLPRVRHARRVALRLLVKKPVENHIIQSF